ncbi:MAG: hypothetical protein HZA08_13685 [Nitrospirae bacterium]|nr:hypothetical protein [Nitrospirota bacterium]
MFSKIKIFLSTIIVLMSVSSVYAATDKGKSDYWLKSYKEVKEGSNYDRAMEIFNKVLTAADRRRGVEPRLYVIQYDGLPWAQSLEDGSIILTKKAIDFCYRGVDVEEGDARLAFVLGHELAHQFNADFWLYRFTTATKNNPEFSGIKEYAKSPSAIKAIELQADQYGIIYSAIAGFGPEAIVSRDTNFFSEWFRAIDPILSSTGEDDPTVKQRVIAVTTRLKDVGSRLEFFHAGLIAYHIGWYKDSIALFEEFLKSYPGREVYHNIGTAYLRLAIKSYRETHDREAIPFNLSIEIDSGTRAEFINVGRGGGNADTEAYRNYLNNALEYLEKAAESDPYYTQAKLNLSAAYILDMKYYNALAGIDEASKLMPDHKGIINNRAIANFLLGDSLNDNHLKERAAIDFEGIAKGECGGPYSKNLSVVKRLMGVQTDSPVPALPESVYVTAEEFSAPDFKSVLKPGGHFIGTGFKNIGEVSTGKDSRLSLYRDTKSNEFVLVKNSIVKALYKKQVNIRTADKNSCTAKEVLLSEEQGYGVDTVRNNVFIFRR